MTFAKGDRVMVKVANKVSELSQSADMIGVYDWEEDHRKNKRVD